MVSSPIIVCILSLSITMIHLKAKRELKVLPSLFSFKWVGLFTKIWIFQCTWRATFTCGNIYVLVILESCSNDYNRAFCILITVMPSTPSSLNTYENRSGSIISYYLPYSPQDVGKPRTNVFTSIIHRFGISRHSLKYQLLRSNQFTTLYKTIFLSLLQELFYMKST